MNEAMAHWGGGGGCFRAKNKQKICSYKPIPVVARFMEWVYGLLLTEFVDSNQAGCMKICLLWVSCVVRQRSLRRADHSSRGVLPNVMFRVWS